MDTPYHGGAPPLSHGSSSRPSLGFPLGTALLLVVIFTLSGVFSCCYHWDKLRRSFSAHDADGDLEAAKTKSQLKKLKLNQSMSVIMPGDHVPKFIAMPCPCQPPRPPENAAVELPKPPPKPPRNSVPLY